MTRRRNRWLPALLLAAALPAATSARAGAPELPEAVPPAEGQHPATPPAELTAPPVAPKSRLPYPAGSRLLVDAVGVAPSAPVAPGLSAAGGLVRVAIVLPPAPARDLAALLRPLVSAGLLPPEAQPVLSVQAASRGGSTPPDEANVYEGPGGTVALGLLRGTRAGPAAYTVAFDRRVEPAQAVAVARATALRLAATALAAPGVPARPGPAVSLVPAGAVPLGPQSRVQGVALQQLAAGIQQSPQLTPRLRRLAVGLLGQATAVTYSSWRTAAPLAGSAFAAFYSQPLILRTWGRPVVRDETDPQRPTYLFQRPDGRGVVMVRAQPHTPRSGGKPVTTLYLLEMEGAISLAGLTGP